MYQIAFKLHKDDAARFGVEECSDSLDINFETAERAKQTMEEIQRDPTALGMVEWLAAATLWVTDEQGNIIYS